MTEYRRSYNRFLLDSPANLVFDDNARKPARVVDLSPRGAGIYVDYSLNKNEKVDISIDPSTFFNYPIFRKAKIAWCNKVGENIWQGGLDFGEDNKISLY